MSNKLKPKKKHKEPDFTWTKLERVTLKNSNNRRKLVRRSFTDFMDIGYYVLYLHHGFGNKRIIRLERTINEYLERAQTENEMKTETLAELLKVRYGIDDYFLRKNWVNLINVSYTNDIITNVSSFLTKIDEANKLEFN